MQPLTAAALVLALSLPTVANATGTLYPDIMIGSETEVYYVHHDNINTNDGLAISGNTLYNGRWTGFFYNFTTAETLWEPILARPALPDLRYTVQGNLIEIAPHEGPLSEIVLPAGAYGATILNMDKNWDLAGYYYDAQGHEHGWIVNDPEPASLGVFGLGLIGLLVARRRTA